jgi:hypothetical protein
MSSTEIDALYEAVLKGILLYERMAQNTVHSLVGLSCATLMWLRQSDSLERGLQSASWPINCEKAESAVFVKGSWVG